VTAYPQKSPGGFRCKRLEDFCVKMKTESSGFRKEWDFSTIPREQLPACFVYEYARELTRQWPRLLTLLAIRKKRCQLPKGHPEGWKEVRVTQLICGIFLQRFGHCPAFCLFPDTPWQNIEAKSRWKLVKDMKFHRDLHERPYRKLAIHTLRELEPSNVSSMEAFALMHEFFSDEELDSIASRGLLRTAMALPRCNSAGDGVSRVTLSAQQTR
jgi:hypothetical protein